MKETKRVFDNDNGGYKFDDVGIPASKDKPVPGIRAKINEAKRSLKCAKRALAKINRQNKRLESLRKQASETWDAILTARDDQDKRY